MTRSHVLLHCQTQGSQRRGVGRKVSGGYPSLTRQPQVGKTALEVPQAFGRRKGCGGWDGRGRNPSGKARQVDCLEAEEIFL